MELQRGICSLCAESTKVFTSSNVEEFLKCLPRILYKNFLTEEEFQKIKDSIKICCVCCYKLELVDEINKIIVKNTENDINDGEKQCRCCRSNKCVVTVKDDWKFFVQRTEGFFKLSDFPVDICYRCVFYFDTIFYFKMKLSYKFPHLAVHTKSQKSSEKSSDTPKRKLLSHSPPSSKKRKIFNNCFNYLQPLCNSMYHVDEKLKTDEKLYKKIAYIDLKNVKDVYKETPKVRPIIKIKLKNRSKKVEKEKLQLQVKVVDNTVKDSVKDDSTFISQPFVKLCKSDEISNKINLEKEKERRRSLQVDESDKESEEKIDETPKAADITSLAPKRRVSLFAEPNDEVEVENIPDVTDNQIHTEEINNIVERYIKDSTFNDSNKLELLEEIEENNTEKDIDKNIEKNGIDETNEENEETVNLETEELKENQTELDSEKLENEEESSNKDQDSPTIAQEPSEIALSKSDVASDGSDSDITDFSGSSKWV